MRDLLPYLILAGVVAVAAILKRGGVKLPVAVPALKAAVADAEHTAADLFAMAQAKAREEAASMLDRKFAEDARKAAIAIYHAPFSEPPAEDKPAA